jgi:hypothetical protein
MFASLDGDIFDRRWTQDTTAAVASLLTAHERVVGNLVQQVMVDQRQLREVELQRMQMLEDRITEGMSQQQRLETEQLANSNKAVSSLLTAHQHIIDNTVQKVLDERQLRETVHRTWETECLSTLRGVRDSVMTLDTVLQQRLQQLQTTLVDVWDQQWQRHEERLAARQSHVDHQRASDQQQLLDLTQTQANLIDAVHSWHLESLSAESSRLLGSAAEVEKGAPLDSNVTASSLDVVKDQLLREVRALVEMQQVDHQRMQSLEQRIIDSLSQQQHRDSEHLASTTTTVSSLFTAHQRVVSDMVQQALEQRQSREVESMPSATSPSSQCSAAPPVVAAAVAMVSSSFVEDSLRHLQQYIGDVESRLTKLTEEQQRNLLSTLQLLQSSTASSQGSITPLTVASATATSTATVSSSFVEDSLRHLQQYIGDVESRLTKLTEEQQRNLLSTLQHFRTEQMSQALATTATVSGHVDAWRQEMMHMQRQALLADRVTLVTPTDATAIASATASASTTHVEQLTRFMEEWVTEQHHTAIWRAQLADADARRRADESVFQTRLTEQGQRVETIITTQQAQVMGQIQKLGNDLQRVSQSSGGGAISVKTVCLISAISMYVTIWGNRMLLHRCWLILSRVCLCLFFLCC